MKARWTASVDQEGVMRILKNDVLAAIGRGVVPKDVERANEFVGRSNWSGDTPLIGRVTDFVIANDKAGKVDVMDIDGAFSATARVVFNDLDGGGYQRVFDLGNGPGKDNVWLGQIGKGGDMAFEILRDGKAYTVVARGVIEEGVEAEWTAGVDAGGMMQLMKDGRVVASGRGAVPKDVERTNEFIGKSNWSGDAPLLGSVKSLTITGEAGTWKAQTGTGAADRFESGTISDTFTGKEGSDQFIFLPGFGKDTITDFSAGAGTDDVIAFGRSVFANYAAVMANAVQSGDDTIIAFDAANTLTLKNVVASSLHADDFRFV